MTLLMSKLIEVFNKTALETILKSLFIWGCFRNSVKLLSHIIVEGSLKMKSKTKIIIGNIEMCNSRSLFTPGVREMGKHVLLYR